MVRQKQHKEIPVKLLGQWDGALCRHLSSAANCVRKHLCQAPQPLHQCLIQLKERAQSRHKCQTKKNKIKYAIKRNISWIKAHTDRIDPHAHLIWSLLKSVVNTVRLSCYCHDMQNNNMIMKLVLLRLNTTFNTSVFCCKHTEHRVRHCLSNPDR